jgi:SAM-dependent methyltransferase
MSPKGLGSDHAAGFVAGALQGRPRVLEVGCGDGAVARRLAEVGMAVTAIDYKLLAPKPAPNVTYREVDFLAYETEPFDAIVFSGSLHNASHLEGAIAKCSNLLAPAGRLIVEDFDVAAPDRETLKWLFETEDRLAMTGVFAPEKIHGAAGEPLEARWQVVHSHEHEQHAGAAMRLAISTRFVIRELHRVDYLYRFLLPGLSDDDAGAGTALHVRATERSGIANGTLVPVGLRIVAEPVR